MAADIDLRDQFAVAALHGLLAGDEGGLIEPGVRLMRPAATYAELSYTLADAMLAARAK